MRAIAAILSLLLAPPLAAQVEPYEDAAKQVHWASAAFFGTGWYRVSDNRKAFIFSVPIRQALREPEFDEDGVTRSGIEIIYPVTFGLHQLDDIPDFVTFDNYGTLTFTPGVSFVTPLTERWRLRSYAHLGVGYERVSGEWARIGYGGVRSHYRLDEDAKGGLALLGGVSYAGYKPEYRDRGRYGSAMIGLESHRRAGGMRIGGTPARINSHLTYSYLFDHLEFHVSEDEVVTVRDEWEIGLALARDGGPIRIGFLQFEQLGLAYQWSSNGAYRAITFNLRSPFDD